MEIFTIRFPSGRAKPRRLFHRQQFDVEHQRRVRRDDAAGAAGAELAYQLGRQALERTEKAEALFIGGGAWLADPAAERLEREFGKPVITSLNGAVRAILKALDCWRPFPAGHGRVLEVE